jgi:hypothetical protein
MSLDSKPFTKAFIELIKTMPSGTTEEKKKFCKDFIRSFLESQCQKKQ